MSNKGYSGMLIKNPHELFGTNPHGGGYRGGVRGMGEWKGEIYKTDLYTTVRCLIRVLMHAD